MTRALQDLPAARKASAEAQAKVKAENAGALLGYQYIAKRQCGRVSAACWDDPGHEKSTAKFVAEQIKRGLQIERVACHKGDQQPAWICEECRGKECQSTRSTI